ncbi:SAM-dependent methyltransferase [Actinophytocola sp.]|uniref:SAM-dependent methyltransferase n=1 Tax=Actinophytocola sp. TaxID=1872138 RepID=UPI002D4B1076|nr:SAM-dependent methyltransferase [Actinophytocola sp.]HYQ69435.1 SAM-dependent methyltransferase [Actinophytocola sp.]
MYDEQDSASLGKGRIVPDALLSATTSPKVGLQHPSVARVYDFLLGGSAYWAMDRSFASRILDQFPEFRDIAKANRMLVHRVVRHLVRLGVRQFVDIGSGMFSTENTHQIANGVAPDTKVVYVDNDGVAVAHAEILLDQEGDPDRHVVVNADLRSPDELWRRVRSTCVLDWDEPVAVLMFSALHSLPPEPGEQDPAVALMARYRELIPVGSYLGISHITSEGVPTELTSKLVTLHHLCDDWHISEAYCRSHGAVDVLLGDFDLVQPGMVWAPLWHPEESASNVKFAEPSHSVLWAGVGRKPPASR